MSDPGKNMEKLKAAKERLKKFQAKKASQSTGGSHSSSPVPAAAASSAAAPPTALGTYFSSAAVVGTPSHEDSSVFSSPIADPFSSIQGNSRQSAENPSYPQQQSHNVQPLPPLASSYFSTSPSAPPLPSSTEANSFSSSFGTAGSAFNALPPQSESFPINTSVAPEVSSESGATAQLPENSFAFSPAANASESSAAATFDPFTSSAQIPPAANVVVSSAAVPTTMDQLSAEISGVLNAKLDSLENEDVILERAKLAEAERKNAELEHQLEQHKTSLKQYEEYCQSLNSALLSAKQNLAVEMAETQAAFEEKNSTLSQDLSSHKETIHIMVGEKTEMEKTIKNLEQEVSKKDVEIVTVLSKLSAAEQALNQHLSGPSASNEATEKALKEVSKLKEVLGQKDQLLEEKSNDILELQSRLRQKEEQESEFKLKLKEQGSKLEMAEVHLSQLRRSSPSDTASHKDNEAKEEAFEKKIAEKEEAIKNLEKKVKESKKTEAELTAYIQQTSHDREQIIHQYTTYSQQLTTQIEGLSTELKTKLAENATLSDRETQLTAHVEQLESQLQSQLKQLQEEKQQRRSASRSPNPFSNVDQNEFEVMRKKVVELDRQVSDILAERDDLQRAGQAKDKDLQTLKTSVYERDSLISELETQLEMLRSTSNVSHDEMLAACESDKVAASRAMVQNKQLKEQLTELENQFIQLTNDKAEALTEVESLRRKLGPVPTEDEMKMETQALQVSLEERDRTIAQLRDQMKYYVAFAENSLSGHPDEVEDVKEQVKETEAEVEKLRTELAQAKEEVRSLHSHNSELRGQLEVLSSQSRDHSSSQTSFLSSSYRNQQVDQDVLMIGPDDPNANSGAGGQGAGSSSSSGNSSSIGSSIEFVERMGRDEEEQQDPVDNNQPLVGNDDNGNSGIIRNSSLSNHDAGSSTYGSSTNGTSTPSLLLANEKSSSHGSNAPPVISPDVAFLKLEQKFNSAMFKIAELSSVNEELEHVNVQLQEETETVGEYITMYQYQRQQIKKRMEEKEQQLVTVSKEREDLKAKLSQLQTLVTHFMAEKGLASNASPQQTQIAVAQAVASTAATAAGDANGEIQEASEALEGQSLPPPSPIPEDGENGGRISAAGSETAAAAITSAALQEKDPTAQKILALFSEIGSHQVLAKDFHPWFFYLENNCGKLQTV